MNKDIENIIKRNLPEKKEEFAEGFNDGETKIFNQALSQINTSLIADEVLKVVVETLRKEFDDIGWSVYDMNKLLSEHLSPNKENKNNG